jgi:hypothetical protein
MKAPFKNKRTLGQRRAQFVTLSDRECSPFSYGEIKLIIVRALSLSILAEILSSELGFYWM